METKWTSPHADRRRAYYRFIPPNNSFSPTHQIFFADISQFAFTYDSNSIAHLHLASTLLYAVWDDHHRNANVNNRDHLVGQLTSILLYRWRTISSSTWQLRPSTRAVGEQSYHLKFFELSSVELHSGCRWTILSIILSKMLSLSLSCQWLNCTHSVCW